MELPVFLKREFFGKFRCYLNMLLNISQMSIARLDHQIKSGINFGEFDPNYPFFP